MSTLDVLVIGLLAISIFEGILGTLRTYMFAHTTNRIDVELGPACSASDGIADRLFPGTTRRRFVARVRELENIRQFLTSSALTLVIDLLFTFVFLAVMFFYSPLLTLRARPHFRSTSESRRSDAAVPHAARLRSSGAAPRTRRSWSKASPASKRSKRWRSNRKCSAAGKSSSLVTWRRAFASPA